MDDLAILNGSVWLEDTFVSTAVYVRDGRIAAIGGKTREARETYDVRGALVLPALIDPHVHFDLDLGTFRSADDFATGSVAAAYGGVGTFVDFLDPTDHPDQLEKAYWARRKQAEESVVDYRFHATIKNPKCDLERYVQKMLALGMTTLKLFTTYADSGRRTYDEQIEALLVLSERYGFTILAHIEDDAQIVMKDEFTCRDLPQSRPAAGETAEALKLAAMVERCGGTLYMVHLSSGATLDALRAQYPHLLNRRFFIESCPQYFALTDAFLQREDGYLYTMAPVLRSAAERDRLVAGFADVFAIGTDHCPFLTRQKNRPRLRDIPMGIGGVEHAFDLMYGMFGTAAIPKMTSHPAFINGLAPNKGTIQIGADADFAIYRPGDTVITADHSRSDHCLYRGFPVAGKMESTIVRGRFVVRDGIIQASRGHLAGRGPDHDQGTH